MIVIEQTNCVVICAECARCNTVHDQRDMSLCICTLQTHQFPSFPICLAVRTRNGMKTGQSLHASRLAAVALNVERGARVLHEAVQQDVPHR